MKAKYYPVVPMLLLVLGTMSACVSTAYVPDPATNGMVRFCDERGCAMRPSNYAQPPQVDDADRETPRIAALKAAAKTEPRAAYDLGLRYFRGDGVRQDSYQALVWMREAAEHGNLRAQKALGVFYLFGLEETGPDAREAEKWLAITASRGDREAQKLLVLARQMKAEDQEEYKWRAAWRGYYNDYYNDWYSAYPYFGVWRQTIWYWD